MKHAFIAAFGLGIAASTQAASLVGLWEFNDPGNLGQATVGANLTIAGTAPTHSATLADDAANSQSGVITTVLGPANNLVVTNPIGANGGGAFTNQYSLLIDMHSPVASRGTWRSLYQTSTTNSNDGELFLRNTDSAVGVSALTYSSPINDTVWNRYVITFDTTATTAYLNGAPLHNHNIAPLDGRFSLGSTFLLFGDEDNENNPLNVGTVAFWNGALTAQEVQALGVAGSPVPEPTTPLLLSLAALPLVLRRRR